MSSELTSSPLHPILVYGYVGNKSAILPLQLHGIEADAINTCQLSNHSGYPTFPGSRASAADLASIVQGLRDNELLDSYTDILTGYIAADEFFDGLIQFMTTLRAERPTIRFLCDPVMGDDGHLYVPESFVAKYRDHLVPLADIITPNQTEAELISGVTITDLASARDCCAALHALGPKTIVITSATFPADAEKTGLDRSQEELEVDLTPSFSTAWVRDHPDEDIVPEMVHTHVIHAIASEVLADGSTNQYYLRLPRYQTHVVGTGDMVTALLLAHIIRGTPLQAAFELAMASTHEALRKTLMLGRTELALVQSVKEIVEPTVTVMASLLP